MSGVSFILRILYKFGQLYGTRYSLYYDQDRHNFFVGGRYIGVDVPFWGFNLLTLKVYHIRTRNRKSSFGPRILNIVCTQLKFLLNIKLDLTINLL